MQIYLSSGSAHILAELLTVRPSVFCAVPLILNRIYENANETVWKMLRNIRYLYCGGSFLHPQIKQAFLRQGVTLLEAYGMTETASVVALADPEDDNTDCNGKILDSVDVRIINADSEGIGEIIVGGANVCRDIFIPMTHFPLFPFSFTRIKKQLPVPLSPFIQGMIPHILDSSRVKMTLPSPDFYLKLPFKLRKKKTKCALSVPWMLPFGSNTV